MGGAPWLKGNRPGKLEPNQRHFLQWNWTRSRKYGKGETMQIKKEMKHAVAIGLFIASWNPLPMHPTPPHPPAPYCLRTPLSSDLQNYKPTQTPCYHLLLYYWPTFIGTSISFIYTLRESYAYTVCNHFLDFGNSVLWMKFKLILRPLFCYFLFRIEQGWQTRQNFVLW